LSRPNIVLPATGTGALILGISLNKFFLVVALLILVLLLVGWIKEISGRHATGKKYFGA
jgi:hypothetical protein